MSKEAATPLGRPRDPGVDERVTRAAMELYGDIGWSGFTVEAVAKLARVGKASIYRRWPSAEALMTYAWEHRFTHVEDVDTGAVRGDLVELAAQMLELYVGESGRAALRVISEAATVPALAATLETQRRAQIQAARAIVRRAIERRELSSDTPVTILLDCLVGGAMLHVLSTPPERLPELRVEIPSVAARLVEFLLYNRTIGQAEPPAT
jgi:AcrR family transcriptional regulator